MVVYGEGEDVPYTQAVIWPIDRVLAVFEVKKSLYGNTLADGLGKMVAVSKLAANARNAAGGTDHSLKFSVQSFARATGHYPLSDAAGRALPDDLGLLFDLFKSEQLAPVRVIFGYDGYVDVEGLSGGFVEQIKKVADMFPEMMPTLVVCRGNSIVKLNGQPYVFRIDGMRFLPFMACNYENPMRLLLEQLWTKLTTTFQLVVPMDDTLGMETLTPLLSCKFSLDTSTDTRKIEYRLGTEMLEPTQSGTQTSSWAPTESDVEECVLLGIAAANGEIDLNDEHLQRYPAEEGFDLRTLCEQLVEKRILAWTSQTTLRPISDAMMTIVGSGGMATTDNAELLGLWLNDQFKKA